MQEIGLSRGPSRGSRKQRSAGLTRRLLVMTNFSSSLAKSLALGLVERFERYARIDTQAQRERTQSPSSSGQVELGRMLVDELKKIGLADAAIDDNGYVMATLEATRPETPTIGLIAHLDVSPDAPADGVEPIVHRDYAGEPIELPKAGTVLDPTLLPGLGEKIGEDIITASGDTLLGADDKAGIAEIMAAVAYLADHPEVPRPTLRVAFTPDEEIALGASLFDVARFGALCAYTIDGSALGELHDETFSAYEVIIRVTGIGGHPGYGMGKIVNAARLGSRIVAALPGDTLTPETTADREGFIHVRELTATAEEATIRAIVRDFEDDLLDQHVELLCKTAKQIVATEPRAVLEIETKPEYSNMRRYLEALSQAITTAEYAIRAEGIVPIRTPMRGGTDGSRLSAMGLPTPNLFAGGHEFHSVREWVSVQDMAAAAAVIVYLAEAWTMPKLLAECSLPVLSV
jgi:tripeptide aminopeptidase